jgi:lipopolysaccharide export system permease protein
MSVLLAARRFMLPSTTLARYMAGLYVIRFLGLLAGLVATLQLLDLLAVSDDILAADGASRTEIFYYLKLRLPQLVSQFIPFTALLATLLAMATLNQHSEIVIMKASGLSSHRILLPMGVVCALIAVLHFAFNEIVLIEANAELRYWEDNEYAVDLAPPPEYSANARIVDGRNVILAEAVHRNGNVVILDQVSIYGRDETGKVTDLVRANFAAHIDDEWKLFEVRRFDVTTHSFVPEETSEWNISIPPERFLTATVEPDFSSALSLYRAIKRLSTEERPVNSLIASLLQKITGPASTLLMPLLGAIAGFGIHRAGSLLLRVVSGMALGFAFFVADNFMMAMGEFGVAPPFLAATAPFLFFLTVGMAVIFYTEE